MADDRAGRTWDRAVCSSRSWAGSQLAATLSLQISVSLPRIVMAAARVAAFRSIAVTAFIAAASVKRTVVRGSQHCLRR